MLYNFITLIFCWKNEGAFHIFSTKNWHIWDINVGNFHETLTNGFVRFEQPGLERHVRRHVSAETSLMLKHFLPYLFVALFYFQ